MDIVVTVIAGLLVLTILVVAHEWGHFIVGRKCGIGIIEFGIGFGPKLYKKVKNGILYSVRMLPLGGFVAFEGEDEDSDAPNAFNNVSVGRRAATIAAGPVMNVIVAIVLAMVTLTAFGEYAPTVSEVVDGSPAHRAGIMAGDVIVAADGRSMDFDMEFKSYMGSKSDNITAENDSMVITVSRNGEEYTYDVPYYFDEAEGIWRIGIVEAPQRVTFGSFEALLLSFKWLCCIIVELFATLGGIIFGSLGADSVAGPVGTISIIGQAVRSGPEMILRIGAMLSLNLGIMNLLPFPALDGGRLIFIGIEKLRGKPFPRDKEGYVHFAGLLVLFVLMILVTYNDIARLISG